MPSVPLTAEQRTTLEQAIEQVRKDLADLQTHVPTWEAGNTDGTKLYRPIAKRILASAQRLRELAFECTYSPYTGQHGIRTAPI